MNINVLVKQIIAPGLPNKSENQIMLVKNLSLCLFSRILFSFWHSLSFSLQVLVFSTFLLCSAFALGFMFFTFGSDFFGIWKGGGWQQWRQWGRLLPFLKSRRADLDGKTMRPQSRDRTKCTDDRHLSGKWKRTTASWRHTPPHHQTPMHTTHNQTSTHTKHVKTLQQTAAHAR